MRAALYLACLALVSLALGVLVLDARHVPPWLALVGGLAALAAGWLDPTRAAPVQGNHAPCDATVASVDSLAPLALPIAPVNRRRGR